MSIILPWGFGKPNGKITQTSYIDKYHMHNKHIKQQGKNIQWIGYFFYSYNIINTRRQAILTSLIGKQKIYKEWRDRDFTTDNYLGPTLIN